MKKLIALSALTVLSATAIAEAKTENGLNYNEVSGEYVSQSVNTTDGTKTFTGYGINASALVSESIFVLGSYASTSRTADGEKTTLGQSQIGLGYRFGLSESTDLNLVGSYSSTPITGGSITGYMVGVGVRSLVSPDVEADIAAIYSTSKDSSTDPTTTSSGSGFDAGLKFKLSNNLFIGINYLSVKDLAQYKIGIGYRF